MSRGHNDNKSSAKNTISQKENKVKNPVDEIVDVFSDEKNSSFLPGRNPLMFNNPDLKKLKPMGITAPDPEMRVNMDFVDGNGKKSVGRPQNLASRQEMTIARGNRLRKIRKAIGMPRAALAALTGINDVNLARVENKEVCLSTELACWICQKINALHNLFISVDWLLYGVGPVPNFSKSNRRTKLVNGVLNAVCETTSIGGGGSHFANYVHVWSIIQQVFQHFFEEVAVVVTVTDRRMEPNFGKGCTVGGRKIAKSRWCNIKNESLILQTMHGTAVIRLVSYNAEHNCFVVSCLNRRYPPEVFSAHQINWLAHVDFVSYNIKKTSELRGKYFLSRNDEESSGNANRL
jgi:DNA-binding XRE family transcriptional regulator